MKKMKQYRPSEFSKEVDEESDKKLKFLMNKTSKRVISLRRELDEWRKQDMMANRKLENLNETKSHSGTEEIYNEVQGLAIELPISIHRDLQNQDSKNHQIHSDKQDLKELVIGQNMKEYEEYFNGEIQQKSISSIFTSDTLDALENAEKLIQKARSIIIDKSHRPCNFSFRELNREIHNENELYIRDIVLDKFDEANGKKKSSISRRIPSRITSRIQKTIPKYKDKQSERNCEKYLENKMGFKKVQKTIQCACPVLKDSTMKNTNSLSHDSTEGHDIISKINPMTKFKNTTIFEIRKKPNEVKINPDLIDIAVQTSLHESQTSSLKFDDPVTNFKSNIVDQSTSLHAERKTSVDKIGDQQQEKVIRNFLNFSPRIDGTDENEENREEIIKVSDIIEESNPSISYEFCELYNSIDVFESDKVNLDPPNLITFDRILCNLDERIKSIAKTTENLKNLCLEKHESNEKKVADDEDDNEEIIVLLKPRIISNSSSCVSIEVSNPPARFSTPLNNIKRVDDSLKTKSDTNINNMKDILIFTSESTILTPNNNVPKVLTMKNKLSSSMIDMGNRSVVENKIVQDENDDGGGTNSSFLNDEEKDALDSEITGISTFPSYSGENSPNSSNDHMSRFKSSNDHVVDVKKSRSDEKHGEIFNEIDWKEKATVSVNQNKNLKIFNENSYDVEKKFCPKKRLKEDEDFEKKVTRDSRQTKEIDVTEGSSIRDRTSYDVSAIYSESSEASIISEENAIECLASEKLQIELSSKNLDLKSQKSHVESNEKELEKSGKNDKIQSTSFLLRKNKLENSMNCENNQSLRESSLKSRNLNLKSQTSHMTVDKSPSSSSSSSSITQKNEKFRPEEYSEGEIFPPSSCTYSLGEVRISELQSQEILKNSCVDESEYSKSSVQSVGEIS